MALYNWQKKDWPHFRFSLAGLESDLLLFSEKTGRISGMMEALPENSRQETLLEVILAEAIKTSEIEGEYPNRKDVLSSIKKNLGLLPPATPVKDKSAAGLAQLMIDVRDTFSEPLTKEKLFAWHTLLFNTNSRITTGGWRVHTEPMQVISGGMGSEKVHFEAPPSAEVPAEMDKFIVWFNNTAPGASQEIRSAPIRSAIAHLYFESIHPFEDGNGRIGRAIAEKALSQTLGRPVILSLSRTIEAAKNRYYDSLEAAQKSLEITPWLSYFVQTVLDAQSETETQIAFTLRKARFFDRFRALLNERQLTVIHRMLKEGPEGFEGGMNAKKYMSITKISKATATRDLQQLLEAGAFTLEGYAGGRSTRYQLNL